MPDNEPKVETAATTQATQNANASALVVTPANSDPKPALNLNTPINQPVVQPASTPTPNPPVAPKVETPEPVVKAPEVVQEDEEEETQPDELTMLKSRAKLMNITFSNNIGIEALRAKVRAKLAGETDPEDAPHKGEEHIPDTPKTTAAGRELTLRERLRSENLKLVRLRIQNLDPKKSNLPGEILTVANEYIGTVRKFVPYGEVTEAGFHVPYVLYKLMKKRKFLNIKVTMKNGREVISQTWAPEFALEVLPQLTPEQLYKLGQAQLAAGSIENVTAE